MVDQRGEKKKKKINQIKDQSNELKTNKKTLLENVQWLFI